MTRARTRIFRTLSVLVLAIFLLASAGCTLVGAGVGAAVGASATPHDPARGALIGAAAGAMTGFLIDDHLAHRHRYHARGVHRWCEH